MHERNLALLSTDAIALDDPGAPTKTRPTAQQRMERARTKPDLIAANRRWTASLSSMPDADRQRVAGFAEPLTSEVVDGALASADAFEGVPTLTVASALHALLRQPSLPPFLCVWATAEWCVPCKRLEPGWRGLAEPDGESHERLAGRVAFAVADLTDEAAESACDGSTLSEALRIQTLPTFVLFDTSTGAEVARAEGAAHKRPARRLYEMLQRTVAW